MKQKHAKYIVLAKNTVEHAVVFEQDIPHRSMIPAGYKPVSAGFVTFTGPITVEVYGSSFDLGLAIRAQDAALISNQLFINQDR